MNIQSTKPYLIRSIFEWCIDSGFTPFISVKAYEYLDLPREHVQNGEIIFNISENAVQHLIITNDQVSFMARFNGLSRKIEIPINTIQGIFAKEINQGMTFSADDVDEKQNQQLVDNNTSSETKEIKQQKKTTLHIVK